MLYFLYLICWIYYDNIGNIPWRLSTRLDFNGNGFHSILIVFPLSIASNCGILVSIVPLLIAGLTPLIPFV